MSKFGECKNFVGRGSDGWRFGDRNVNLKVAYVNCIYIYFN